MGRFTLGLSCAQQPHSPRPFSLYCYYCPQAHQARGDVPFAAHGCGDSETLQKQSTRFGVLVLQEGDPRQTAKRLSDVLPIYQFFEEGQALFKQGVCSRIPALVGRHLSCWVRGRRGACFVLLRTRAWQMVLLRGRDSYSLLLIQGDTPQVAK